MKVSVVTVSFNSIATIGDTIESVVCQSHREVEYIVVDGGSTDGTIELLQKKLNNISVLLVEPDGGIYDAMNKGMKIATGDIIGFLNSDDVFADQDSLARVVEALNDPDVDCCYGDLVYSSRDNLADVRRYWHARSFHRVKLFWGWMPPHPTFYAKASIYRLFGGFSLSHGTAADYELMLRLLLRGRIRTKYIRHIQVRMREGGASNVSFLARIHSLVNDARAWSSNESLMWLVAVPLKPLFKVESLVRRPRKIKLT